jgi:hypothetical protein
MTEKETAKIFHNAMDHITTLGKNKPELLDCTGNLEACQLQGSVFYSQAKPREANPYPKGTAEHEWFDAGFIEEQEELCGEP